VTEGELSDKLSEAGLKTILKINMFQEKKKKNLFRNHNRWRMCIGSVDRDGREKEGREQGSASHQEGNAQEKKFHRKLERRGGREGNEKED